MNKRLVLLLHRPSAGAGIQLVPTLKWALASLVLEPHAPALAGAGSAQALCGY